MAMQLKESYGDSIMRREEELMRKAKTRLKNVPNLVMLDFGNLPVLSFLIRKGAKFLHYNFVSALLNDLYGIQSRGGCACAGPYAQGLLGIDQDLAEKFESVLVEDERLDRKHLRRGHSEYSSFEILR